MAGQTQHLPAVTLSCATRGQRLDEDAQLLEASISTHTHADDTDAKTVLSYNYIHP